MFDGLVVGELRQYFELPTHWTFVVDFLIANSVEVSMENIAVTSCLMKKKVNSPVLVDDTAVVDKLIGDFLCLFDCFIDPRSEACDICVKRELIDIAAIV
jgi:hypothetical protein